jgi:RNA polymerase sigma factor (sigma-70 family)
LLRLYRVAPEDGEDVLQEALLALWRKRAQVKDYEAWLLSALRLECLRYRRRESRQSHSAVDEAALEQLAGDDGLAATDPSLHQDLRRLVQCLPARHQALIHLRYGLGLTLEETASRLGYRLSSLKKTTTRCLQVLRSRLSRRRPTVGQLK